MLLGTERIVVPLRRHTLDLQGTNTPMKVQKVAVLRKPVLVWMYVLHCGHTFDR
jgi:hypothetical protein